MNTSLNQESSKLLKSTEMRVEVPMLRMGMYISDLDVDWQKTRFLFKGFLLENEEQMGELRAKCKWVVVSRLQSSDDVIRDYLKSIPQPVIKEVKPQSSVTPVSNIHTHPSQDTHKHTDLIREEPTAPAQRYNPIVAMMDTLSAATSEINSFFATIATKRRLRENYNPNILNKDEGRAIKQDFNKVVNAKSIRNQFKTDENVTEKMHNHVISRTLLEETKQAAAVQSELLKVTVTALAADLNSSELNTSIEIAKDAISEVVDSVSRNPDAMQLVSKIKVLDDYSYQHAIQVSLLMIALGRELCIGKNELVEVGLGGLLHDVGEIKPPENVAAIKRLKFITKFKIYKDHVEEGVEIARKSGYSKIVQAIIENHHEFYDGSGYPRGRMKGQLGLYGNMIVIVDHYVSMTTGRNCEKPVAPNLAIAWMHGKRGTLFHPQILDQFTQVIGVYPVGSKVLLSTNDVGFVIKQNKERRLKPVVMVVMDKNGNKLASPIHLDLMELATTKNPISIKRELPPDSLGLLVEDYI